MSGTITALPSTDGFLGQVARLVQSAGHTMTENHRSRLEESVVPHLRKQVTAPVVRVQVRGCGNGCRLSVFLDGRELTGQPS